MFLIMNPANAEVMQSLNEIITSETEKPHQEQEYLLKVIFPPEFLHSLSLTGVKCCYHISYVTSDQVWVSDADGNLFLKNTAGDTLHFINVCTYLYGFHTVNSDNELIYMDMEYNIYKLSKKMKTATFIKRANSIWKPQCMYWSPSASDLLVGMYRESTRCTEYIPITQNTRFIMYTPFTPNKIGKVTRYNQNGQLTQNIQHDNTGRILYRQPNFITENNNGDVVVSDSCAVIVTNREGGHRFSYLGHPSGSGLDPCGICTDALSQILVSDHKTESVHMLNKDGQFLSYLPMRSSGIFPPCSLSYDVNNHNLWVGSWYNNTVFIFGYKDR